MNSIINIHRTEPFGVRAGLPRWVEFPVALCALIVISPLLILVAVIVKLTSQGSVLFKQERVGQLGKNFVIYKFRTMRVESDEGGPQITIKKDDRITWIGGILRRTKLDELPELWNIVRGDMAIVGPRPEVPRYVLPDNPLWKVVLQARPGITDTVTLRLRNEEELLAAAKNPEQYYLEVLQPEKLKGYLKYLKKRTWKSDLRVIKDTIVAIIFPFETPPPKVEEKHARIDNQKKKNLLFSVSNFGRLRFLADLFVLAAAFIFSYLLRFEFAIPQQLLREAFMQMLAVVFFQYLILRISGISKFVWRYISLAELKIFVKAVIFSAFPFILFRLMNLELLSEFRVPMSVIIMDSILAFGGLISIRILRRSLYERYEKRQISVNNLSADRKRAFLIGAGRAGQIAAREIMGRGDSNFEVAGFIDDDPSKLGKVILGVRVCGVTQDLPQLAEQMVVENAILTIANTPAEVLRRIIETCEKAGLNLRIMPGLYKLFDNSSLNGEIIDLKAQQAYQKKSAGGNDKPQIGNFKKF